ncbi:MAG: cytochrome C [Thermomicrobiales bacterium]|nr:cytochrome C [Thermomicrobiales bacterium]
MIATGPSTAAGTEREAKSKSEKRARGISIPWFRLLLALSGVMLAVSTAFSYWALTLHAPQYPGGLRITVFTHKVTGDVREVDGLNHYIGMMPLADAASLERTVATYAIIAFVIMALAAAVLKRRWAPWLAAPIVLFPIVFAADLYFWLYRAGHNLDPTAALSSSIKPFTPAIIGEGIVGQFSTTAMFGAGWFVALAGAIVALIGMVGLLRRGRRDETK